MELHLHVQSNKWATNPVKFANFSVEKMVLNVSAPLQSLWSGTDNIQQEDVWGFLIGWSKLPRGLCQW